jgi:hypothetical protein
MKLLMSLACMSDLVIKVKDVAEVSTSTGFSWLHLEDQRDREEVRNLMLLFLKRLNMLHIFYCVILPSVLFPALSAGKKCY